MQIDQWISKIQQSQILTQKQCRKLIKIVSAILIEQSNVQPVSCPVNICGDIHGQFYDLLQLFKITPVPPQNKFIFLGDLVDRGYHSIQTVTLILCYKAKYPQHVTILRGNHQTRSISKIYGFYDQICRKYGNANPWKYFSELFDLLPLSTLIQGQLLCVHGGLSPQISTINEIRSINRFQQMSQNQYGTGLLWSDPQNEINSWQVNPRGVGWLFGKQVVQCFLHANYLSKIIRAHQLVNEGYKFHFNETVITVWSAPNYCYRCGNKASIMHLNQKLQQNFSIFNKSEKSDKTVTLDNVLPYFL